MSDRHALIAEAAEVLPVIQRLYKEAARARLEPVMAKRKIMIFLTLNRSYLDYLAYEISERYGTNFNPERIYYPLGNSPASSIGEMDRFMVGVRNTVPGITKVILDFQPHRQLWMKHLSKLVKVDKHRHFSVQAPNRGSQGKTSWNVAPIQRNAVQYPANVRWRFVNPDVPVLPTLSRIQAGTSRLESAISFAEREELSKKASAASLASRSPSASSKVPARE